MYAVRFALFHVGGLSRGHFFGMLPVNLIWNGPSRFVFGCVLVEWDLKLWYPKDLDVTWSSGPITLVVSGNLGAKLAMALSNQPHIEPRAFRTMEE